MSICILPPNELDKQQFYQKNGDENGIALSSGVHQAFVYSGSKNKKRRTKNLCLRPNAITRFW
jgi:hypothetical protein